MADSFERRDIAGAQVFERARAVIDGGDDLAWHRKAGMDERDLRKRAVVLAEVTARLLSPSLCCSAEPSPHGSPGAWLDAMAKLGHEVARRTAWVGKNRSSGVGDLGGARRSVRMTNRAGAR